MPLRELLRLPGVAGPFAASIVGRLPMTAMGLLLILHVEALSGRIAVAGLAAGAYAAGLAVGAPLLGRLIDRHGPAAVLVPCAALGASACLALAAMPPGAPAEAAVALAVPIGVGMPPLGSTLRALWTELPDPAQRHAAFALDSAVVEALFVVGPVAVAGGLGAWSTRAAFAVCAAALVAGTVGFVVQPAVRAWRAQPREGGLAGPLAAPVVRVLLVVLLLLGAGLGAVEVGIAAAATADGHRGWAGPLLGLWGLGSMVGALLVARRPPPADRSRALVRRIAALAAVHALLAATTAPLLLAPLLPAAGLTIAPALNAVFVTLGEAAPRGTVTEAFTWATCAISAGVAAGSALGGAVAEASPHAPFLLVVALGALAAGVGARRRTAIAAVQAS